MKARPRFQVQDIRGNLRAGVLWCRRPWTLLGTAISEDVFIYRRHASLVLLQLEQL